MRRVLTILQKDLLRRWRSPLAPVVFLLFPFVFSGLIALAFGSDDDGRMPRFALAVVDEDGGIVARLVRGALGQDQAAEYLEVRDATLPEAMRAIEHNRIAGAIVIPAGFTQAIWNGERAELRVIRNPAQAIGPLAVEETAEFLALLLSGARGLLAEPLARIRESIAEGDGAAARGGGAKGGDAHGEVKRLRDWADDAQVAEISILVNRAMAGAGRFLLPPAIRIEKAAAPGVPIPRQSAGDAADAAGQAGAGADTTGSTTGGSPANEKPASSTFRTVFQFVLPGMAAFALFILAVGLTADIFAERRAGTLARQMAAPLRDVELIFGKMLATVTVGAIVAALMALIGALLLGARADPAAFVLLALTFLLAVTGFVTLLYGFARNEQRGATLASIVLMVMAFLGGSFIPLDSLPGFVRGLAPFTLNYWAIEGFQTLLFTDGGIGSVTTALLVFLAVGLGSGFGGAALLRRQLVRGE